MRKMAILLFLLLTSCWSGNNSFQCDDPIGCVQIKPGDPIKIGVLQAFSGALASNGTDQMRGIELALADRGGKLLGHPVELQQQDSLCSGEGGMTAALKIVADRQFVGVLGTYCSGAAVKASKIISEAGMVMISATNTSPDLTGVAGRLGAHHYDGYFRTAHNDTALGVAVAKFAHQQLGIVRAATISDGDSYTKGLAKAFCSAFVKLGGKITLESTINKEDKDMKPVLKAVLQSEPELVFYPIFRPAGDFISRQSTQIKGFEKIIRITADGLFNDAFLNSVGKSGRRMYFALPDMPDGPAYNQFVQRYKKAFKEAPVAGQHAHAYDAANLLFDAIEKAAIQHKNQTLYIKRQAIRDALYITEIKGITGKISCNRFGDCGVSRFKIVRLDDPAAGLEALASNIVYKYRL